MIKKISIGIFLSILVTLPNVSWAETKIGLGTGARFSRLSSISLPIKYAHWMIEPYIGVNSYNQNEKGNSQFLIKSESQGASVGIGFLRYQAQSDKFEYYYGFDMAYGNNNDQYTQHYNNSTNASSSYISKETTESSIFSAIPKIGISYLITERFSFSIESGFQYMLSKGDITEVNDQNGVVTKTHYKRDIDNIDSFNAIVFRMYF